MAISLESSSTPLIQMYPPDPRTLYTWQRCGRSHAARYVTVSCPYQILRCTQVENRPCRGNNHKEGFELRVWPWDGMGDMTGVQGHGCAGKHLGRMQVGRSLAR